MIGLTRVSNLPTSSGTGRGPQGKARIKSIFSTLNFVLSNLHLHLQFLTWSWNGEVVETTSYPTKILLFFLLESQDKQSTLLASDNTHTHTKKRPLKKDTEGGEWILIFCLFSWGAGEEKRHRTKILWKATYLPPEAGVANWNCSFPACQFIVVRDAACFQSKRRN